ncbi:hypothetical protein Cfor_08702, partial [Coptotermes formosanus]
HYMLVWKKGIAVLAAGPTKVTPDNRIRLVDGYNLEISNVQTQDAGDYACQIATLQPIEIIHTVEILAHVNIRVQSIDQKFTSTNFGNLVKIQLLSKNFSINNFHIPHSDRLLRPLGEQNPGSQMRNSPGVEAPQRECALCTSACINSCDTNPFCCADAPEIEVERGWVHSGEGNEAQLACIVHAEPPAEVLWYRDTMRLDTTERRIMEARGSRHTLIIRKVQASDFANYTCMADNQIGKTRQKLELSGRPNPAIFVSDPRGKYRDMYNISWNVNSYTPIEEFKLYFRKLPDNDTHSYPMYGHPAVRSDWNDVILSPIPSGKPTQKMTYLIRGLEPSSQYEARVEAKNRFGWSQSSDSFTFYTTGVENSLFEPSPDPEVLAEPEVRDLGMTAYNSMASSVYTVAPLLFTALIAVTWS